MTQQSSRCQTAFLAVLASVLVGQCWAAWKPCTANNGEVLDLTVNAPRHKDSYVLQKGTNVTLNVAFWATADAEHVTACAHGMVMGVPIRLKMPNEDGCRESGIECPVKNGERYTYVQHFEVKPSYPKMSATLKLALGDDKGGVMACVLLPVEIVE